MAVIIVLCPLVGTAQTQHFLSEMWTGSGGTGALFYKNSIVSDQNRNVYVAGSTINGLNNSDVMIQKFTRRGVHLWTKTFAGAGGGNDAAVDMVVEYNISAPSSVFIVGTVFDSIASGQDLLVQKYGDSGVLEWNYKYSSPGTLSTDIGTAITTDGTSIYVAGASTTDSTMSDYVIISLNKNTGVVNWITRYDAHELNDYPAKIAVSMGTVYVTGASQDSLSGLSWSIATVALNVSTGVIQSVKRINSNAVSGVDDIADFTIDAQSNVYLVGAKNGGATHLDMAVYKLDDSLNLVWENFYDFNGLDDKGSGIKVDNSGNVYVTGYASTSSEGKQVAVLKTDVLGNVVWKKELGGAKSLDDKGINLVLNGNKVFVAASVVDQNYSNYKVYALDANADLLTEATSVNPVNLSDVPEGIAIDLDGNIIVTGKEQMGIGVYKNKTVKYVFDEKTTTLAMDTNNIPMYAENEMIVRFDRSVVNTATINKRNYVVGNLEEFVNPTALDAISNKLGVYANRLKTHKIFNRMTMADSISISRLGDTVKVEDFWATLLVTFSGNIDEFAFADSLNTLPDSILHYAEPNYVGVFFAAPNDNLYLAEQSGLFSPTHGINVENAWDKQVGRDYVKVGVYDSGINWRHEDFGDGTWNGSKIKGGWDFYNNIHISNQSVPDSHGHGTAVAGIIGALRNNTTGIAGIAGGDVQNGNTGVQLFSMTIPVLGQVGIPTLLSIAASAIIEGAAFNPNTGYGYGLHIQNHSWGSQQASFTLSNAVKNCYINNCVFVVSSGNDQNSTINYPASYNDNWVMKVGANDANGSRANFSTYGNNLDFIAPGTNDMYKALSSQANNLYVDYFTYVDYFGNLIQNPINGTSFAAPHVSGVAGLLYSEHNTYNGYPNNLAPEDMEMVLQNYATDVQQSGIGYDQQTGFGRINAGATLDMISYPHYYILHSGGTNSMATQAPAYNLNVILANNTNNIAAGQYVVDRYPVTNTFLDILPSSQTIVGHWPRFGSSVGISAANPNTGDSWFSYTATINQNVASITTTTYCWWVKTSMSGQTINKWLPDAPNQLRTTYSLHVHDANGTASIDEKDNDLGIHIYPNPTVSNVTIDYFLENASDGVVEVMDMLGHKIATYPLSNQSGGHQSITINLSGLASGIYVCTVKTGGRYISKKIIKN